ncbi:MAG TPA: toll/interleukin-1 receptor domain-containing protein [Thermoguttaceae bacterium]|nr:toll/interleukin-1 receptor domain-containing protein [Thermoguttaceae bacterium]
MSGTVRNQVFISYSHQDRQWLDRVQTALKPLVRNQTIDVWDDGRIKAGQKWRDEITRALARAKVAVLLVSQNFLASDFIADEELLSILAAAEDEGLTIVWIPVTASLYDETDIAKYQAAHNPESPLDSLPPAELNQALVAIAKKIGDAANP